MDAGELGSRNLSVNWIEVPPGASEDLLSHEEAEQVYIVVAGTGTMSATGDTQELAAGDFVMIPPATEHSVSNDGTETLALQQPTSRVQVECFVRKVETISYGQCGSYPQHNSAENHRN